MRSMMHIGTLADDKLHKLLLCSNVFFMREQNDEINVKTGKIKLKT